MENISMKNTILKNFAENLRVNLQSSSKISKKSKPTILFTIFWNFANF